MAALFRGLSVSRLSEGTSWVVIQAILLILGLSLIVKILAVIISRTILGGLRDQSRVAARKGITYIGIGLVTIIVLDQLGVELTALLGAAGVVGIAVGIASQASLSNVISGLFLVSEKTIELGDVIKVGERTGVVHSIDPLSIKLRTFDNLLVRIPNQQLIDRELINVTKFPIRRLDIEVAVSNKHPLEVVSELLKAVPSRIDLCLDEPEPVLIFRDFSDGNARLTLGVWFEKQNFIAVKNATATEIQRLFAEKEIPLGEPSIRVNEHLAEQPDVRSGGELMRGRENVSNR